MTRFYFLLSTFHFLVVEVIPAINAETWSEVVEKVRLVEPYASWVHIDVADGTFTPNTLWHDPADLVGFETKCRVEIHRMTDRPEDRLDAWLVGPVERFIVQCEVARDLNVILAECRKREVQVGLSADSHTPWERLQPFVHSVDLLQVLAVHAGKGGQEFERHNIEKIKHLRAFAPKAIIEVDGGIVPDIADDCARAGANILAAGHYIFSHPSPQMAMRELQIANG